MCLRYISVLFILSTISCQPKEKQVPNLIDNLPDNNRINNLPDNKAGEVVRKAIERAGGWSNWKDKKNFSFYKKITHLDSLGNEERTVRQKHTYQLKGKFKARMVWSSGEDNLLIINNGEQAKKYKNGEELTDQKSKNEAWNSSYGSHYVIGMPYKLTDPGVTLTYEGIDTTVLDVPVHSIRVEYSKDAGSTGGMHLWYYYFKLDDYDLAGNYLDYGEGHSFTSYEVFEAVNNHRIHNKRFSYISNKEKERLILRTVYENEEMKFDKEIDENAFELK